MRVVCLLLLWVGLVVMEWAAHGFVVTLRNPDGSPLVWNLEAPDPRIPETVIDRDLQAIRYHLRADGWSTSNREAELNAVRACFDQWASVPGSRIRFVEGDLLPETVVDRKDGTNVVFWVTESATIVDGMHDIRSLTGISLRYADSSGQVVAEVDTVLNGKSFRWFTDFSDSSNGARFVETTMLHEIGHMLGVEHSSIGGATMYPFAGPGVTFHAGLSMDEQLAARVLYPDREQEGAFGKIEGQARRGGAAVLGAMVYAEDSSGAVVAATPTDPSGRYELPGLSPGDYRLRVSPLDPLDAGAFLIRGAHLAPELNNAVTDFAPLDLGVVSLSAGQTFERPIELPRREPPIRILSILPAGFSSNTSRSTQGAVQLRPGDQNRVIGVYGVGFGPAAQLSITGTGIVHGEATFRSSVNRIGGVSLHQLWISASVAMDATPGLRTFIVRDGDEVAYAHGFVEIEPISPDFDFDGLDDRFQRQHFDLFTSPEADPGADPDNDGFVNRAESVAATDPNDSRSFLKVESVRVRLTGTTVVWSSRPGRRYRVYAREDFEGARWEPISGVVDSLGIQTAFIDSGVTDRIRFYRVAVVE